MLEVLNSYEQNQVVWKYIRISTFLSENRFYFLNTKKDDEYFP